MQMTDRELPGDILVDADARRHRGMSAEEKEKRRQRAICAVLQKTNRILLGSTKLSVDPVSDPDMAPGWTTGAEIFINFGHILGHSDEEMLAMWGLNYHELAHVMLTPRVRGKLREMVRNPQFRTALNLAEDWRIETQFASLFEAADRYFQCTFKTLILNAPPDKEIEIYPLAAGRAYLSPVDRERWRREFVEQHDGQTPRECLPAEMLADLKPHQQALLDLDAEAWSLKLRAVGERYATQMWSKENRDHNQAIVQLVEELMVLVPWTSAQEGGNHGLPMSGSSGVFGPDLPSQGQTSDDLEEMAAEAAMVVVTDSQEETQRINELLDEVENASANQRDTTGDDGDASDGQRSDGDAQVVVDLRQSLETEVRASDTTTAGQVTAGAGAGGYSGQQAFGAQLSDEQREALDRIMASQDQFDAMLEDDLEALADSVAVQRDLSTMRNAVSDALADGMHLRPDADGAAQVAPNEVRSARNRLLREIRLMRSQLEGAYVNDQSAGKVHMRSWLNAAPSQKVHSFRAWLPDELDAAGLEVVGLIDRSSSMSGILDHASQVTWALASAIQQADGKVTLIGFADPGKEEVLLGRDTPLDSYRYTTYGCYGGTTASKALGMARQVLAASPMPNRLMYIVTDGAWSDTSESLQEIRRMNADGVTTVNVLLGAHMERERRGCHHVVMANDVSEMGTQLQRVIRKINQEVVRQVALERGGMIA